MTPAERQQLLITARAGRARQLGDGDVRLGLSSRPGELQQAAELDLRLYLGPAGLPEAELPAGLRILPGVDLGAPRPARQLLYVTGSTKAATAKQRIRSVHEPVTNRPVKA